MNSIFSALLISCLITMACGEKAMTVKYYNEGKSSVVNISSRDDESIKRELKEIVRNIGDISRVYVDSERFKEMQAQDELIEIVFTEETEFESNIHKKIKLNKILIPITGDFGIREKSDLLYVFVGIDEYDGSPYEVNNSKERLSTIISVLKNK